MISLDQFVIKKTSDDGKTAAFEIGPLPKGFGNTLANTVRRILLSSVPGSAITAVQLEGVQHEYSTLDSVSDDVLAILLSLKNIVVVSKTIDPVVLEIDVKGKDGEVVEVKAGDIKKNSNVDVINPEYVITKLTGKKGHFKAKITVERGEGYAFPNEELRKELGVLPVDALFSPVKLVDYSITPTRVGQHTDLDQINLTVRTNGAVTPVEAMHVASDILKRMSLHLNKNTEQMLTGKEISLTVETKRADVKETKKEDKDPIKVLDLNLSTRLTNALLRSNYDDLRKLEGLTEEEVANIRGMGSKSFAELLDIVKKYGIKLV